MPAAPAENDLIFEDQHIPYSQNAFIINSFYESLSLAIKLHYTLESFLTLPPIITLLSTAEDLGILTLFLDDLKLILERFVNEYAEDAIGVEFKNANLIPIFRNSFPAARRALMISINRLNEPDEDLLSKLDDHGLRGQSLVLKIGVVNIHKKASFRRN